MKAVTIIGGGLAGLGLGNALARSGVPVRLMEAGSYPRHKVCGEFICGRGAEALADLGLADVLLGAKWHRTVSWKRADGRCFTHRLPEAAAGLSRHELDRRMAEAFTKAGGELLERNRFRGEAAEGIVFCSGRAATKTDWIGLKFHCANLRTAADLEMHLGKDLYLGLSGVENGRVNVCALARRIPGLQAPREELLLAYLRHAGLGKLAQRLAGGGIDPESHAGVAGVAFATFPSLRDPSVRLGDAFSVIPPFTGNGMSLALESAVEAQPVLLAWARGELTWVAARNRLRQRCLYRFGGRLLCARFLHPWLNRPRRQGILFSVSRLRLLPIGALYRLTH
jgi:flavin-dependent dehydrogenase